MAEKLRTFDWTPASNITPEGTEKVVYPWEEWLDGDIWQLTEGEDFDTHPLMMERIIRTRATARGAKVRLRHQPKAGDGDSPFGTVILQRTDVKGPGEQKKAAQAQARADKKVAAEKAAAETLSKAGIKPVKKVAAAKNGAPVRKSVSKRPAKGVKHSVSKRPARKVGV